MSRHLLVCTLLVCACHEESDPALTSRTDAGASSSPEISGTAPGTASTDAATPGAPGDPAPATGCQGVTCSGKGTCVFGSSGQPACQCAAGYSASGLQCLPSSACTGVSCKTNEHCDATGGKATCVCDAGFSRSATGCVKLDPKDPCYGMTCGGHGYCQKSLFLATCVCDQGYVGYGMRDCVLLAKLGCLDAANKFVPRGTRRCDKTDAFLEVCADGNGDGLSEWIFGAKCNQTPCSTSCLNKGCADGQPCPVGTSCVEEAHGEKIWACIVTCDCSNCGNCSMADFSASKLMGHQCGDPTNKAAAKTCKLPCPDPSMGCLPFTKPICWIMEGCFSAKP